MFEIGTGVPTGSFLPHVSMRLKQPEEGAKLYSFCEHFSTN